MRYLGFLLAFVYLALEVVWTHRHLGRRDFVRQTLLQVYFTGVGSVAPVALLGLAVGAGAVAVAAGSLGALSGAEGIGRTLTVGVLRGLGPLLTGGVVIARSVTAIAAELGAMRAGREIEALEAMGVPPIGLLVTPRLAGGVVALYALEVVFGAAALAGGLAAAGLAALPAGVVLGAALSATSLAGLARLALETAVAGCGLFAIACYHGMAVEEAPTEVPAAVADAALNAFLFLVLLHAAFSLAALGGAGAGR